LHCRFQPFLMKKCKNEKRSDNPGFLGYKVNRNFLTEKLPYSQFFGTKVDPSYKKRRHSQTRRESHKVYQSYQMSIHGDEMDSVGERQWRRFLLDNPFREETANGSNLQLGLYHCQYRLDGKKNFCSFF